jgi:NAD(P)-dependent dehydrogenase (short-subunit alcohol dehydrogenase family)
MAILVTGGTGFVGLNLVEALLARGDSAVILRLLCWPWLWRGLPFGCGLDDLADPVSNLHRPIDR